MSDEEDEVTWGKVLDATQAVLMAFLALSLAYGWSIYPTWFVKVVAWPTLVVFGLRAVLGTLLLMFANDELPESGRLV